MVLGSNTATQATLHSQRKPWRAAEVTLIILYKIRGKSVMYRPKTLVIFFFNNKRYVFLQEHTCTWWSAINFAVSSWPGSSHKNVLQTSEIFNKGSSKSYYKKHRVRKLKNKTKGRLRYLALFIEGSVLHRTGLCVAHYTGFINYVQTNLNQWILHSTHYSSEKGPNSSDDLCSSEVFLLNTKKQTRFCMAESSWIFWIYST